MHFPYSPIRHWETWWVLGATKSLAEVVERHVSAGGRSKDKEVDTERSVIDQFRRMGPPEFKGTLDHMKAKSWIM